MLTGKEDQKFATPPYTSNRSESVRFAELMLKRSSILGESEKSVKRSLSSTAEIKMNTRNMVENRPHKN